MGMDLIGRAPSMPKGRRLSLNQWTGWEPLVDCVQALAPNEAAPCGDWVTNDCPGLDEAQTAKLVAKLKAARDRGAVANYAAVYKIDFLSEVVEMFIDFAEASGGFASFEAFYADRRPTPEDEAVTKAWMEARAKAKAEREKIANDNDDGPF